MNQKNKLIALIAIIAVIIIIGAYLVKQSQPTAVAPQPVAPINTEAVKQVATTPVATTAVPQVPPQVIAGKVRSINEKQVYIELADGKGAAVNINAATPVKSVDGKMGNLSILKTGAAVSITVNKNTDALEISIK